MVFGANPTRGGMACRYCPPGPKKRRPANEIHARALMGMPNTPPPPDSTGPMGMQPQAHSPTAATEMLPTMPRAGEESQEMNGNTPPPTRAPAEKKKPPTRAEAVRAARARITRRKSLKKQRDAQKS